MGVGESKSKSEREPEPDRRTSHQHNIMCNVDSGRRRLGPAAALPHGRKAKRRRIAAAGWLAGIAGSLARWLAGSS
jgi:hypothetical protein